ncbi:LD-carboxypeptidase [Mucilaginibacter panaciglaebae]|uniref:LD-carboxypeptidase n=2 Tax=Mucilaginibacter panaciglaebae TaxID=502331 RepID=A0ABP7X014_9SPHI
MTDAIALLESWGLEVVLGDTVDASYYQFAGDDDLRASDMQHFIDNDDIKAIIAARGGYGTIRMIDKVNFERLKTNPKWIIGFSDITLLHAHLYANYGLQTIHGQMPVNIPDASSKSLQSLKSALLGSEVYYHYKPHGQYKPGAAEGILIGGNLSLLIASLGSVSDFNYDSKILFIEDVGEYLYAVDRMIRTLDRAGKLKNLAGLIVGGFTDIKDNDVPFGQTITEIVMHVVKDYTYPVCFDFPAGHIPDNRALILGRKIHLEVSAEKIDLNYL